MSGRDEATESADEAREAPVGPPRVSIVTFSDRELVERTRRGDTRAFGQFVRRHQQKIFRLAVHLLRDKAEAEDVTQEAFVRAFKAIGRFDGRSEPYTWLYRIAINLSLNALRSRRSRPTGKRATEIEDARLESVLAENGSTSSLDPRGQVAMQQRYRALCQAVDSLSETLRMTLVLVCIDGQSHEETAQILGVPEGTIAWRVHEARRKLREFLEKRGFSVEGEP